MPSRFTTLNFDAPFVLQDGRSRSLHFTAGELQSRMRLEAPDALEVDYTRTMMGFLLLNNQPHHIAMIGMGGGSLLKFCHRHLPGTRLTVVENNPAVVALRHTFAIPDDDARLSVLTACGAAWVQQTADPADVLLVDGFDAQGQPEALCSTAFYRDCQRALAPEGVMVVNLHADHPAHIQHLQHICHAFQGNVMQAMASEKCNVIVFARRGAEVSLQALRNADWSASLCTPATATLRGEFARIGWVATGTKPFSAALP